MHPAFASPLMRKSKLLPWSYQDLMVTQDARPAAQQRSLARGSQETSPSRADFSSAYVPSSSPAELGVSSSLSSSPRVTGADARVPETPTATSRSRSARALLPTPTQIIPMLIECVKRCHKIPLADSCPESLPEKNSKQLISDAGSANALPLDIGAEPRAELMSTVLRLMETLAWTMGSHGFHECGSRQ